MRLFSFLVAILVAGALVAGPVMAQTPGSSFGTSPTPTTVSPGVSSSMTGGIPGTLGGTSNAPGGSMTGVSAPGWGSGMMGGGMGDMM